MPLPLFDPDDVTAIHDAAIRYAVKVQKASSDKAESERRNLVATSALSNLAHEMVCLHRAIKDLSLCGWAFAAPILLRSIVDAMCSIAVIANSDRPDVAAFRYFYALARDVLQDVAQVPDIVAAAEASIRAEMDEAVKQHMAQMTEDDQRAASDFLGQPPGGHYWYSGLFQGPTAIIRQFFSTEVLEVYRFFSSATHAAFIGMRLFRDDPGLQNINPRKDPRAAGFSILVSSRMLIDGSYAIAQVRGLGDMGYNAALKMIRDCKQVG